MDASQATREVFWNIEYTWLVYVLMAPTLALFGWGFWLKIRRWRAGQPAVRFDRPGERFQLFLRNAVGQGRTLRSRYAGLFHSLVYTGFIVLLAATTVVAIHHDTPLHIMQGHFYLIFQSLIVDIFGLFVLVGVALAAVRRWIAKPAKLVYTDEASWILIAIFVMAFTGFMVEGWRIAVTDDVWAAWSPVGNLFARASDPFMSDAAMQTGHVVIWWFHLVVAFGFIAWVPFSKMSHVITAPLNIFTANLDGYGGSLKTIDFESAERFGINHLADFTWKDLLDFDACTECGRCTDVCPANTVGKSLSPHDIILDLQTLMHDRGDSVLAGANGNGSGNGDSELLPIIDEKTAVSPEALFACTTCAACMEACPVHIEQMPKIVDARRYLVMEEAEFPEGMMDMMNSLESRQHPFAGTQFSRVDWTEGLDIDVMADMDDPNEAEVLMWVGCGGALVERNRNTVRATAKLLKKAGVKFAILGREESCSGDPARRVGNEFLFEMLAKGNVETMKRYDVRKVVTSCPHCFNSFKNEYPQFGGSYEVYHHTQFLDQLVGAGRLEANGAGGAAANGDQTITFHDPCYLGRHNGEYDAPRNLLAKVGGARQVEMQRSRNQSFCCGGGGGMAFVDEPPDQRVNQERAQEAVDTGADVVAVGCPFCATMLDDGVNARRGDRDVKVKDVAELLLEAVGESDQAAP